MAVKVTGLASLAFFLKILSFHSIFCGLYTKDDPMEILDNSTIKNKLYESKYVWVVEFYSSWCGHCHAFAPTWKRFARELKGLSMESCPEIKLWKYDVIFIDFHIED